MAAPNIDLPSVTGSVTRAISILLINPNGTSSMTQACLRSLLPTIPPDVTVTGFTAPHPTPSAIEGHLDGVLSAAAAVRAIVPIAHKYDAFLVACFSAHPLINALREEIEKPVVGIMEAALYTARMLGGRLGVVGTSPRSKYTTEGAIRSYGLEGFSAGAESTGLGVLELETKPRTEVLRLMKAAAERLLDRDADCILLGCAGMTEMKQTCQQVAVPRGASVVDGVGAGIQLLAGLVREGLSTSKAGIFVSSEETRRARGQSWL